MNVSTAQKMNDDVSVFEKQIILREAKKADERSLQMLQVMRDTYKEQIRTLVVGVLMSYAVMTALFVAASVVL